MILRHYLITPNERKEVKPLNFSERQFKYTLKTGKGKNYYAKELSGDITFIAEDFDLIKSLEEQGYSCNPLYLESFARINGADKLVYKAILRIVDMQFDLDKCIITSPCKPYTPYRCIESSEDDEINILEKVTARASINLFLGEYEFYESTSTYDVNYNIANNVDYSNHANASLWTDGGAPPSATCFRYWKLVETMGLNTLGELVGSGKSYWVREKYTVPAGSPPPPGYTFIETVGANDIYAKPLMVYHNSYTSEQVPVGEMSQLTLTYKYGGLKNGESVIRNAVKLQDALEWFGSYFCDLGIISDFFQMNPENPSSSNYVTGARNQYTKLYLIQKTDVKKPNATQPATRGILRYDYLMESLQTLFDVRYNVTDDQSNIQIEHISRYNKTLKLDASVIEGGKWINGQRKFEFISDEMPRRQLYKAMEAKNIDFVGKPIEYYENCTDQGNEEKNNCQNITTDICHVIDEPDEISDDGFVLVACEEYDGKLYLAQTTGVLTSNEVPNNVLAFAQLHQYFHRHRRVRKTGLLNGAHTIFITEKPTKKATDITFPYKDITLFEPDQLVKGALGNGEVKQAVYDIKSDKLQVTLLLTTNDAVDPEVEEIPKTIYLELVMENRRAFTIPYPNPWGLPGPGYDGFYYNIVAYAWSDAAGTIPAYPGGFNILWKNKWYKNSVLEGSDDQVPITIAAHKTVLGIDLWGEYTDTDGNSYEFTYELIPSTNYTII